MNAEEHLRNETEKWAGKIAEARKNAVAAEGKEHFLRNIDAYISDSAHFMEKGDLIRSFEAIVWAWAWLEIGTGEGFIMRS